MNLYLACSGMMMKTYADHLVPRFVEPTPRFAELRSYWELRFFSGHTLPIYGRPYFIDSGAFSAYSKGQPVTLDEYSKFLDKYHDQIDVYANLDSIPKQMTPEAREQAAMETLANQQYLESFGLKPLPVFHMGEPYEYLESYLEEYEYICLGGLVDSGDYDIFFNHVWENYLTDGAGRPTHKIHAFGMTSVPQMVNYPWFSVDSSTWLVHSKIGYISYPKKLVKGWDWNDKPLLVAVSDKSSARQHIDKHYDTMSSARQESVREYLSMWNLEVDELRKHPVKRFEANLEYWIALQNNAKFSETFRASQYELL